MAPVRPTELSELHSSLHGRARREERCIEKIDLQRARRYGMAEQQRNGRIKYTYGGIVFIYCPIKNREITSFPSSDRTGDTTGTKFAHPILLQKELRHLNYSEHEITTEIIRGKPHVWTSHSVLVIDMSGSMRRDDVNGARCRSDGVFLALARDYIKAPLDKKERGITDLISIIIMRDDAEVLLHHESTTYALYNKIIDLRDWDNLRPAGHGNYVPAIKAAEALLTTNASAKCALSLLFFSDGRPSDKNGDFTSSIGDLASKFGRRFSLACIGMADGNEDFSVLGDMVDEAKSYGTQASFGQPSLDSESLSSLITSLASSVTSTRTEMTEVKSGKSKAVQSVTREKTNTPDKEGKWNIYLNEKRSRVVSVSAWNYKKARFVKLIDPRCAHCHAHVGYTTSLASLAKGSVCGRCNAYFVCHVCERSYDNQLMRMHLAKQVGNKPSECDTNISKITNGDLKPKVLPSFFMAFKEKIFSEGAERMVRKVRFVDSNGNFIGPPYVAKESRFIENHKEKKQQRDYHINFMTTQNISADFAIQFNEALDNLHTHFVDLRAHGKKSLDNIPRIKFIEPTVVHVVDGSKDDFFLIEKFLHGEYKKFNNNNGYICRDAREDIGLDDEDDLVEEMKNLGLGAIEEGDEDEDSESDTDDEDIAENLFDEKGTAPLRGSYNLDDLKSSHIPQAFSHFSYVKSRKRLIVVDLQGVLTMTKEGKSMFELTDPVIHRRGFGKRGRQWDFGRTDKGKTGIKAFFKSHKCSEMCKLLGLEKNTII